MKQATILTTIKLLMQIRKKDKGTFYHSMWVAYYAARIVGVMNMTRRECRGLMTAALLHDVGKLYIPVDILRKPGSLTEEEYGLIKQHAEFGCEILQKYGYSESIQNAVKYHHERPDGNGYFGCVEISDMAAIIHVADCLEVMAHGRPYQKPKSTTEIISDLRNNAKTMLDARMAAAAICLLQRT